MKKVNRIKLALDIVMFAVLLLMYRRNVLGLSFHEIGGLAVCGLFIIHILLNGKWVLAISGKLLSPKIAWRNKLNWVLDLLLLLCFTYILVSGVFISKVLFAGQQGASAFKTGHYAVSALALALVGIHIGLHYCSIISRTPARKLPLGFRRAAAIVMSVLILGFGVYQMTATSFFHWMSNVGAAISSVAALPEASAAALSETGGAADTFVPVPEESGRGNGNGRGNGGGKGNGGGNLSADPSQLIPLLLNFASIALAFATITAWIDGMLLKRKQRKRLRCDLSSC